MLHDPKLRPWLIVGLLLAWILLFAFPAIALWLGLAAYLVLLAQMGWSVVRYRRTGWISGLLLALLLATLPVWVIGLNRWYASLIE